MKLRARGYLFYLLVIFFSSILSLSNRLGVWLLITGNGWFQGSCQENRAGLVLGESFQRPRIYPSSEGVCRFERNSEQTAKCTWSTVLSLHPSPCIFIYRLAYGFLLGFDRLAFFVNAKKQRCPRLA
ncbi:hypothetical protein EDB82DRAFT_185108 [Fusarium venenatum]|uniref:uncharacterized protein n=1 Tax=Fusarium venenatum TaxID=56646 RepID=UPI001DB5BB76|nr:hypothetical protein EDB82DRAFT_358574 [Fusarium venenatum]KAH6994140.1 hypothetical protein EDB82DRAFT_185108 [Fusarium venenatum]